MMVFVPRKDALPGARHPVAEPQPFPAAPCGGSPRTGISPASRSIAATTPPASQSAHQASSSDPAKLSSCEPPPLMLFSCGESSSTTAASKASTARYSETKVRTYRPSLSDRLTQSLIDAGLVCGITPTSIRQLSGQPIQVLAFAMPVGGDVGSPRAVCSSLNEQKL